MTLQQELGQEYDHERTRPCCHQKLYRSSKRPDDITDKYLECLGFTRRHFERKQEFVRYGETLEKHTLLFSFSSTCYQKRTVNSSSKLFYLKTTQVFVKLNLERRAHWQRFIQNYILTIQFLRKPIQIQDIWIGVMLRLDHLQTRMGRSGSRWNWRNSWACWIERCFFCKGQQTARSIWRYISDAQ